MLAQLNARTTTKLCGGRLSACAEAARGGENAGGDTRSRGFPGEAQSAEVPRSIAQERIPKAAAPEAQPRTFQRSGRGLVHGQPSLAMNFARSTT